MPVPLRAFLCGLLLGSAAGSAARAADHPGTAPDFERDILPIFEEKCVRCHGEKKRGGKLDMRTLDALLAGGDTGPAIRKGNAAKSLLVELIHHREMPPKKETPVVTPEELERMRQWINAMEPAP